MTAGIAASDKDAYDQICAAVSAVATGVDMVALLGAAMVMEFGGVLYQAPIDAKLPLLRVVVLANGEKRRTLSTPSRVTTQGIVDLQLIFPRVAPNASAVGRQAADIIKGAIIRRTEDVVFYKAVVKDAPADQRSFIWRVQATFNYDLYQ